mmetsp:Transcript_2667/g.6346  ORF Transcript_2667/g.6346 Transcript_2667/m.6346 type:complete len:211 (-) Transcript_2667:557-1189(-)
MGSPSTAPSGDAWRSSACLPAGSGRPCPTMLRQACRSCWGRYASRQWASIRGSRRSSSASATCRTASGRAPGRRPSVPSLRHPWTRWTGSTRATATSRSVEVPAQTQVASTAREVSTCTIISPCSPTSTRRAASIGRRPRGRRRWSPQPRDPRSRKMSLLDSTPSRLHRWGGRPHRRPRWFRLRRPSLLCFMAQMLAQRRSSSSSSNKNS